MRREGTTVRERWARLPTWARWALAGYVIGFIDGTIVHVEQLAHGGIHAYAGFGYVPVQVFLVLLVAADPAGRHGREPTSRGCAVGATSRLTPSRRGASGPPMTPSSG